MSDCEKAPRQPHYVVRDIRETQQLFDDPDSRKRQGAYDLQVKLQQFRRELQEAREFWIRRVV